MIAKLNVHMELETEVLSYSLNLKNASVIQAKIHRYVKSSPQLVLHILILHLFSFLLAILLLVPSRKFL